MLPVWCRLQISIHALREEGDAYGGFENPYNVTISIHALREEGDVFQCRSLIAGHEISIHALREEGDGRRNTPAGSA